MNNIFKWNEQKDSVLREFYNDRVHVDPVMLALGVGLNSRVAEPIINKRLRELGLRKCFYPESQRRKA